MNFLINRGLFDLKLAVTILIVEVPIAVFIAWLVPIVLQRERREMQKQLIVEKQWARDELKRRREEVVSKLTQYDSGWAILRERISKRDISSGDDLDIEEVRLIGNRLNTILTTLLVVGDYGEKEMVELKALARNILSLGTDIMKAFEGSLIIIDDIKDELIKRGDKLLETSKVLKGKRLYIA